METVTSWGIGYFQEVATISELEISVTQIWAECKIDIILLNSESHKI